jgi:tetratricopeptide (TPR) repeat protein
MSPLRAAVVAAAFAPLVAAAEPYRCEARGGPAWREYRTAHFLLATDLSSARAEAVVRDLEQLHALVVQALVGEGVEIPGKVRVVAFADPRDFEKLAPDDTSAYLKMGSLLTPIIVFPSDGFQADPVLVAHELAHHVSWYLFPRQPRWFSEGLAGFVETIGRTRTESAPQTGSHIVRSGRATGRWAGMVRPDVARWFREWGGAMPPDLLTWSGAQAADDAFRYHAWSWLLYHWMWNTRPKAFTEFTGRLSNAADPDVAWRECFPDLDPSKPEGAKALADALERYVRAGRFASYEVKATSDARFAVAPLAPAEVHMLLQQARIRRQDKADAAAEIDEALREDPLNPIAAWFASNEPEQLRALLRKTTAARPDDWRAWNLLAGTFDAATDASEKEAALRKALALNPQSASVRNNLAWLLVGAGRAKEALPHANAAADLAPWSPEVIDTLATVAAELGKCAEARVLQRRAVDLLGKGDEARERYEKRLADLEARCGPGGGVASKP